MTAGSQTANLPNGGKWDRRSKVFPGWRFDMEVIGYDLIGQFIRKHSVSKGPLNSWYQVVSKVSWKNLAQVKQSYPAADLYGTCTIFNIGGNTYRLIAKIDYRAQVLRIRRILTHAEYDKDNWKTDC